MANTLVDAVGDVVAGISLVQAGVAREGGCGSSVCEAESEIRVRRGVVDGTKFER